MSKAQSIRIFFIVATFVVLHISIPLESHNQEPELRLENTAKYVGSGRYEWKVFVVADNPVLDQIDRVVYTLHLTLPNPVKTVQNRDNNFALKAKGWGDFNISAEIVFKNGKKIKLYHWIELKNKSIKNIKLAPKIFKTFITPRDISTENTAKKTGENLWEWEVFLVGDKKTLDEVRYVEYTLHPTFRDPVKKIEYRGVRPDKGFYLKAKGWGTFTIGVKVVFRNGEIKNLKHPLVFR